MAKFSLAEFARSASAALAGQMQGRMMAQQELERKQQIAMEREAQYDQFLAANVLPHLDKGSPDYANTLGRLARNAFERSQGRLGSQYVASGPGAPFGGFQASGQPTDTSYLQRPPSAPVIAAPGFTGPQPGAQPPVPQATLAMLNQQQIFAPDTYRNLQQMTAPQAASQAAAPALQPSPAGVQQVSGPGRPAARMGRLPERAVPPEGTAKRTMVARQPEPGTFEVPGVGRVRPTAGIPKEGLADLRKRYAAAQAARVKGRLSDNIKTSIAAVEGGVNLNPKTYDEYVRSEAALRQMEGLLQGTNATAVSLANDPWNRLKQEWFEFVRVAPNMTEAERGGMIAYFRSGAKSLGKPENIFPKTITPQLTPAQAAANLDRDEEREIQKKQHADRMEEQKLRRQETARHNKVMEGFSRDRVQLERIRTRAARKGGVATKSENERYGALQQELKVLTDEYNTYKKDWNLRLRKGETPDESIRGGEDILAEINAKKLELKEISDIWRMREEELAAGGGAGAGAANPSRAANVKARVDALVKRGVPRAEAERLARQ